MERTIGNTHRNLRDKLALYFQDAAVVFTSENDRAVSSRKTSIDISQTASLILEEQVTSTDPGQEMVKHILSFRSETNPAKNRRVILENGQVATVEGMGENLSETERRRFAKNMFHGFVKSVARQA